MTPLARFLTDATAVASVTLARVRGSSPRAAGTRMFVSPTATHGTIGGGQLEYMAIDEARALLARGEHRRDMDLPLGPEIGQCCGGRVEAVIERMDAAAIAAAIAADDTARAALPCVLIFGAGHVGRALERALRPLPVRAVLIDSRAEELAMAEPGADTRLTPLPEAEIASAPAGSVYLVMTHDHGLDFLLVAEALKRGDAAQVGMIGSKSKRGSAHAFCRAQGLDPAPLVCPIGAWGTTDKRPEVIAALVAADLMNLLLSPARMPALG
jgi:xanthine dehydrogenase accessory factor